MNGDEREFICAWHFLFTFIHVHSRLHWTDRE
jgi:hypothetical protein